MYILIQDSTNERTNGKNFSRSESFEKFIDRKKRGQIPPVCQQKITKKDPVSDKYKLNINKTIHPKRTIQTFYLQYFIL